MSDKFLGIDVSTTAVKALLVDQDGAVLGEASTEHPVDTPRALWSEQNPLDWWDSTLVSMRKLFAQTRVRAEEVKAIDSPARCTA